MQLTRFACAHCGLSGSLPAWGGPVGTCYNYSGLQFFDVSHNSFAGIVPGGFDSFGGLSVFDVGYNQLSGTFLTTSSCAGGFPKMEQLRMSHNNFTTLSSGAANPVASSQAAISCCKNVTCCGMSNQLQ